MTKPLQDKTVVVFGAAGSVGAGAACALAADGAIVYCAGRRSGPLESLAAAIGESGGQARVIEVDAFDEQAVGTALEGVVAEAGRIDAVFNAVSPQLSVTDEVRPSLDIDLDSFTASLRSRALVQFVTARAAARHMISAGGGTIIFLSATPARGVAPMIAGDSAGFGAVEGMARCLAREWGPKGVRVVCLRSGGMPDTPRIQKVWETMGGYVGAPSEAMAEASRAATLTGRMATVAETGEIVAFLASDRAATLTGAIVNSSYGEVMD